MDQEAVSSVTLTGGDNIGNMEYARNAEEVKPKEAGMKETSQGSDEIINPKWKKIQQQKKAPNKFVLEPVETRKEVEDLPILKHMHTSEAEPWETKPKEGSEQRVTKDIGFAVYCTVNINVIKIISKWKGLTR